MDVVRPHRLGHLRHGRVVDVVVPDLRDRRGIAVAHAGRPHDAHLRRIQTILQRREQLPGTHHLAGQAVAHPDGQRRRRRLVLLGHVEVGIERRGLVHGRLRQPHLLAERSEVRGREMPVTVLDQMQMLDQQITPARPVAEQRAHLGQRLLLDLAPLRLTRRPPLAGTRMAVLADRACGFGHPLTSSCHRQRCEPRALPGQPGLVPTTIGQGAHSGKRQPVRAASCPGAWSASNSFEASGFTPAAVSLRIENPYVSP